MESEVYSSLARMLKALIFFSRVNNGSTCPCLVHSQSNSHSSSLNFLLETRDVAQIAFCLFIGNSIVSSIFLQTHHFSFH